MAPKMVHQNMAYHRNFGENGKIYDVSRFACQYINYEIDYIFLITYNDKTKFCRLMVHNKRQFRV